MEFRKANRTDIEALTEIRMEFVTSIREIADPDAFRQATEQHLRDHIDDGSLHFYVCSDREQILSSCLLCVTQTIPTPGSLNGRNGLLLNVYTRKDYRKQGLAKTLLETLIADARTMGLSKILLDYTDDGYPLYQSLGFVKCDRDMELKL